MGRKIKKRKAKHLASRIVVKTWKKVFRDPIHDLISLGNEDEFILDLVDAKEFQRLRRIRQLGLAHLVYPGAEHSRFIHSLGVFNFARRMIDRLQARHSNQRRIVKALDNNSKIIKTAALLHDLGHGPFSHVYERVFPSQRKHEHWTCEIIRDTSTEIHNRLIYHKIPVDEVMKLIWDGVVGEYGLERPEPYLKDIVSSQLDADRMDYLLRDSSSTGAQYGSFDHEWILNALAIGEIPTRNKKLMKLCLDQSKGMGAIQGFLIARMLMTRHVYGHKTTRAYEGELLMTLRLAAKVWSRLPEDTPKPVITVLQKEGKVSLKEYLLLDDEVTMWALRRWAAWEVPTRSKDLAALQHHSLRLVRRLEPWQTLDIREHEEFASLDLFVKDLRDTENPLYFECYADDGKFLPYKNLQIRTRDKRSEGDEEERFFRTLDGIYLIDKQGHTLGLEKADADPIIEALAEETVRYRFFFNRDFQGKFARLLVKYGVKLEKS